MGKNLKGKELGKGLYQRKDGLRYSSTEAKDVKIQFFIGEIWTGG